MEEIDSVVILFVYIEQLSISLTVHTIFYDYRILKLDKRSNINSLMKIEYNCN